MRHAVALVVLAVVAGSLSGSTGFAQSGEVELERRKVGEYPAELGIRLEVGVGDVVYSKFDYTETLGISPLRGFQRKHLLRRLELHPGDFLKIVRRKKKAPIMYCPEDFKSGGSGMGRIACYRDSDEDGKLDRFHIPGTAYGKWFKVEDPIPYKEAVDLDASEGYRRELLYQGIAGDVVRLAYREYVDSLVRPAYEQEVTYTLESGPTEVAFRGATLRIISASNLAIVYEVLSGFRE